MKTHVEFRSDQFPPYEDEENETNPGVWGKRLAEFLVGGLTREGFEPGAPIAEDWGWVIPIRNDAFRLWIGCGVGGDDPDGFLCFIEPHTPSIRRLFRRIDTVQRVSELQIAMDRVLSGNSAIRDKRWRAYDE